MIDPRPSAQSILATIRVNGEARYPVPAAATAENIDEIIAIVERDDDSLRVKYLEDEDIIFAIVLPHEPGTI